MVGEFEHVLELIVVCAAVAYLRSTPTHTSIASGAYRGLPAIAVFAGVQAFAAVARDGIARVYGALAAKAWTPSVWTAN